MFSKPANDDVIRICELKAARDVITDGIPFDVFDDEIDTRMLASIDYEIEMLKARIPVALDLAARE